MDNNPFSGSEDIPQESINKVQDLPDGSSVFEIMREQEEEGKEKRERDFYENLAEDMESARLSTLAMSLLDDIKEDKTSREEWEKTLNLGLKYLGIKVTDETDNTIFPGACSAYDSTLLMALIRGVSTARAELFPATGPAKTEIVGVPSSQTEDEGERVKLFMNHFLTQIDTDYYPDSEQLLYYIYLAGCAFRKICQDPILNRPNPRMVKPQDLIVNMHTTSLLSSSRITHVMKLTKREVIQKELQGVFLDSALPMIADKDDDEESSTQKTVDNLEGIDPNSSENKSLFDFYECHTDLDDDEIYGKDLGEEKNQLPKPYIVTICCDSKKIVSIKRNWEESDESFKRIECFVSYYYLRGFGIYGLGLAHVMGSNSITLTSILRQLIDAGTLKNFPGGLKTKGLKAENNDRAIGPGSFVEVETGGQRLADCVMLMPYGEPSAVLVQLRQELVQQTANVASTADSEIPEIGANAPVGTTLAMLEVANKVQSSILRSLHVSLGNELKLLFKLFGKYLPDEPYPFLVPGGNSAIMRKDFSDRINIAPVSDPNVLTSTHRLITAESLLKLAQSNPEIHDIREVYKRMYAAMNIENIDKILISPPEPEALDPLTENAYMSMGKPITISMFQDDDSHIVVHKQLLQDPMVQSNAQAIFQMQVHIQYHKGQKIFKQMIQQKQQQIQMQIQQLQQATLYGISVMPNALQQLQQQQVQLNGMMGIPSEQIMKMPEVQNMIAMQDAAEINQQIQQQQQEMQEQKDKLEEEEAKKIDPNQVALADIEQRREASFLKDEEAKLRAETEAFKATTNFEGDLAKMESQENMAVEKNQVALAIEQMKHEPEQIF